jgi:Uma2 family endonuclease
MSLPLKVIKLEGEEMFAPYLLRVGGWTEERYFAEAPETRIMEFEDGEIIMPSPVNTRHQDIVRFLTFLITGYAGRQKLGKVLNGLAVVRLRPHLDYEPDIFFIANKQLDQLGDQYFSGAPALVIEVMSVGSRNYDLKTKAANYREHGVQEYWAVDPDEKVLYRHLLSDAPQAPYLVTRHTGGRLESGVLSGFWIEVSWLWQEPLPAELECLQQILGT